MIKHNQDGAVSGAVISLVLCVMLLIGAMGFGAWAFTSRQDYKDNSDQKAAAAAEVARKAEVVVQEKHFAEEYKKPLKIYNGPESTGSLHIEFPKTWSGYMVDSGSGGATQTLEGYFAPGVVPSADAKSSVFALRVSVLNQPYASVVNALDGRVKQGEVSVSAYALPKLPKVVGVKAVGQVQQDKNITMIVLPLRSQTLQIWTEGNQFMNDFDGNILKNFSFSP